MRDKLIALEVTLPGQTLQRLNDATAPELGFPTDFINRASPWVFGAADITTDRRADP